MRRLLPVVLATLLAALLLVPATGAGADTAPRTASTVLAAEGGGEEGPVGPEPRPPDDPDNSFAPSDYEPPFLINAAVGLTVLLVLLALGLGAMYWLLVQRPKTSSQA